MSRKFRVALVLIVLVGILTAMTTIYLVKTLNWRAQVVMKKAGGNFDNITWADLLSMMTPGSPIWLQPLADGYSLYGTIRNPYSV